VQRAVVTPPEVVEDAWLEFVKYQPDRMEGRWRRWLFRVAQREAWRLSALEWKERPIAEAGGRPNEPLDPRDRYEERLEFQAALQELRKLPPQALW
jgi:hypothetical protein